MRSLITADLHFTDSERDSYRWDVFSFLEETILDKCIDRLLILGDLTERKDNHSSFLVNKITTEIVKLSKLCPVVILMGTHDYKEKTQPYFKFLNEFKDITFISEITQTGKDELFLPHTQTPKEDWKDIDFNKFKTIFCHQTLPGALADNGYPLKSEATLPKKLEATLIAGDIHKPQNMYVGAPHAVDFGDVHDARMFILENNKVTEIPYLGVKKWHLIIESVEEIKDFNMNGKDQCKVTLWLDKKDYYNKSNYEKEIRNLCKHVTLFSIEVKIRKNEDKKLYTKKENSKKNKNTLKKIFNTYIKNIEEKNDNYKKIGSEILKNVLP